MTVTRSTFAPFVDEKTVLLTTYRRDGTPVGTPVNVAVDGDRAFLRTYETSWKVKRLRNNPEVEIAPSTARGRPTGPAIRARARQINGEEAAHARRAITGKHPIFQGVFVSLGHRLPWYRTVYYELTPIEGGEAARRRGGEE